MEHTIIFFWHNLIPTRYRSNPCSQPAFTCSKLTIEALGQRCEICSKLTVKTPKQRQWHRFDVFVVNFEHISHLCSSVSIVNFKHVIASWVVSIHSEYPIR